MEPNSSAKVEYESTTGFIAIIDALGISRRTLSGCEEFLKIRDSVIHDSNSLIESTQQRFFDEYHTEPGASSKFTQQDILQITEPNLVPKIFTIGDTIIVALNWSRPKMLFGIQVVCTYLSAFLGYYFSGNIKLRGALSYDEYITDNVNTVLGPAVASAAKWYESHDLATVVVEPSLGNRISIMQESRCLTPELSPSRVFQYLVPTKHSGSLPMWVINWPFQLQNAWKNDELQCFGRSSLRELMLEALYADNPPPEAMRKVVETQRFFDHAIELVSN